MGSIPNPVKKRRRKRTQSLDARIQAKAREIHASQMAAAMNAAIGMEILQKLDELNSFIAASGYRFSAAAPSVVTQSQRAPSPPPNQVENPCIHCGRAGVYRTKPNKFNVKGSWFCRDHAALGGQTEIEDRMDAGLLGAPAGPPIGTKPAVVDASQMIILPPTAPIEAEVPAAAPMADALALAMGEAEIVQ